MITTIEKICPVCGYDALIRPPRDYMICPCCGTEFGNDDDGVTHEALRQDWIKGGARWFSRKTLPPVGWNPVLQLMEAGYAITVSPKAHALASR